MAILFLRRTIGLSHGVGLSKMERNVTKVAAIGERGYYGEGDTLAVMDIPRVARGQRAGAGIALAHDGRRRGTARQAKHPFGEGRD